MNNNFNQIQKPTGFGSGFAEPPQLQIGSPFNNNCDAYLNTFKYNEQQQYNYKSPYYNNLKNNNLVNLLLNNQGRRVFSPFFHTSYHFILYLWECT